MEITEVKVFPIDEEKLKAFVSVVFDRCFMVNDIKIIHGRDGLFISMPSRKKKNGEFKDVAHPLNNETRQMIEMRVVEEYERVLGERGEELPAPARAYPGSDAKPAAGPAAGGDESGQRDEAAGESAPQVAGTGDDTVDRPAPPPAATPAAEPAAPAMAAAGEPATAVEEPERGSADEDDRGDEGKSLEEVQERHLRDSFWSVS